MMITSIQTSDAKTSQEILLSVTTSLLKFLCFPLCCIYGTCLLHLRYITIQPVDQVVGLVVMDEPRPTGRTPENASSGSSSSDKAAHRRFCMSIHK